MPSAPRRRRAPAKPRVRRAKPEPIVEIIEIVEPIVEPVIEAPPPPPIEAPKPVEPEAAPKAAFVVSATQSCALTERKWHGYPVWQCAKCRVDTMDPALAAKARRACRKSRKS